MSLLLRLNNSSPLTICITYQEWFEIVNLDRKKGENTFESQIKVCPSILKQSPSPNLSDLSDLLNVFHTKEKKSVDFFPHLLDPPSP